jgi:NAD(P)-dependent dehydrogenase (short-subunit alcohol dehydrogenase family)
VTGAVVVTGASSGIGAATAASLAERDLLVFAGVRNEEAARAAARRHHNIRPVRLDVTDAASIAAAAATVRAAGLRLAGIVNNAGIAVAGPLEYVAVDDLRTQFEVNVIGQIAVTQAFLPHLRADRGRIVFVGSISGRLAVPFISPYSASKFALRALVDALRIELAPAGIAVALIEPGSVNTPIWRKGRETYLPRWNALPAAAAAAYGAAMDAVLRQSEREERGGLAPEHVSRAIAHALLAPRPKAHYVVGTPARIAGMIVSVLPPRLHDRFIRRVMRLPAEARPARPQKRGRA